MPHMDVSPFDVDGLVDGSADGWRDADLISEGREPLGPDPAKDWSARYRRAYEAAIDPE